jgi:hypothetical protein
MDGNDLSKIDIKICVIVFVKFSSTSKKLGRIGADAIWAGLLHHVVHCATPKSAWPLPKNPQIA